MRRIAKSTVRDRSFRRARLGLEDLEGRQLMASNITTPLAAPVLAQSSYVSTIADPITVGGSAADGSASGLNYIWDFGDGTGTVQGVDLKNPSHVYSSSGTYYLSLTVADSNGNHSPRSTASINVTPAPIPELARWQSQMITYGSQAASRLTAINTGTSTDSLLGQTYYDAERVFLQIAAYTGDNSWLTAASNAEKIYRDGYLTPNGGILPGYWIFSKGLLMDYQLTGDTASRDAVLSLASNAAYAPDNTDPNWTADATHSREVAYNIMSELAAEELGTPRRERTYLLVDQALSHIDQWFVSKTAPYMQPFMVGLTCDALIQWYDKTHDPRVPGAVKTALDSLWSGIWDQGSQSFLYMDRVVAGEGGPTPAPDLNLLIAPAYAWYYHETGDPTYRNIGDQVFAGGVRGAWLAGSKQFDQNYKWSFDYVNWRTADPLSTPFGGQGPNLLAFGAQAGTEGTPIDFGLGSVTAPKTSSSPWTLVVNWGDGTPNSIISLNTNGLIPRTSHTFSDNGVYQVTETLISADGSTSVVTVPVTVANVAPVAAIGQGPYSATVGIATTFRGSASDVGPKDSAAGLTYTWDFGDGTPAVTGQNLQMPTHSYSSAGTFNLTLRVSDKDGGVSNVVSTPITVAAVPSIADYVTRWGNQMVAYGTKMAANLASSTAWFGMTTLDGIRVFQQIAAYTNDPSWTTAIQNAKTVYRDKYVIPNGGGVGGGMAYSNGLAQDFLSTGDNASRDAVVMLSQKAAYISASTPLSWITDASKSVQVAQGIQTFMDLEDLGYGHNSRIESLVSLALGDLDQWFGSKTASSGNIVDIGQTLQALIRYQQKTGNPNILPAVKSALDWLWTNSWDAGTQAFRPINRATATGFGTPGIVQNMMIAPAFAWVYLQTGNAVYRDRGDQAFISGVVNGSIGSNTDFDTAYNWSFSFVQWRNKATK